MPPGRMPPGRMPPGRMPPGRMPPVHHALLGGRQYRAHLLPHLHHRQQRLMAHTAQLVERGPRLSQIAVALRGVQQAGTCPHQLGPVHPRTRRTLHSLQPRHLLSRKRQLRACPKEHGGRMKAPLSAPGAGATGVRATTATRLRAVGSQRTRERTLRWGLHPGLHRGLNRGCLRQQQRRHQRAGGERQRQRPGGYDSHERYPPK